MIGLRLCIRFIVAMSVPLAVGCNQDGSALATPSAERIPPPTRDDTNASLRSEPAPGTARDTTQSPQAVELRLLKDLDEFRSSSTFSAYGFGRGGPHRQWIERVQEARKRADLPFASKIALGELQTLGLEYIRSQGRETESTRWFRRRVVDPLGNE